ncbi:MULTISPECIES: MFS transporter [Paraburkholderia]|nr:MULTISPECIES: MFS transporter [Paraburkholderia]RKR31372.1 sugar phosphate permease [Paraburkholderia sp. BL17N1]
MRNAVSQAVAPHGATSGEDTWPLYSRIAWKLIPIIFLVQIFGFLDRANVGFAKLQMQHDLALSNAAYGLGAGIFFIGYFLFEIPSNLILDRVGAKLLFARTLLVWGLATIAMAFVKNDYEFYALRFIIGVAEAGFAPGTQVYLSQWFPARYRGRINGVFLTSLPIGLALGGPIAGLVMSTLQDAGGHAGWQWLFVIEGAVSVALVPLVLKMLPNRLQDAGWLADDERRIVADDVAQLARQAESHHWKATVSPMVLCLTAIYFLVLAGNYGIGFWLPQIIRNSGVANTLNIGLLSSVPYIFTVFGMLMIGKLSDRAADRSRYLVLCSLLSAVGLAVTALWIKDTVIALTGVTMVAVGILGSIPVFWAVVARRLTGAAAVVGFAFINSVGNLAGFVSPYGIGIITDRTGTQISGLYALSVMSLAAAILLLLFVREKRALIEKEAK